MDLIVSWLLFPLLLAALCGGCGLLADRLLGSRVPGALIGGLGLALIIVIAQFTTLGETTAPLTTPLIGVLALAGLILGHARLPRIDRGALAAALLVFAVYAAPIVLSGEATIAGFIKLDDTATWLAFSDRIIDHGIDLDGLAPSTYEATLKLNIGEGYPIGVFLPFAVAAKLTGVDPAWLIQPYIAALAALLALALWQLAAPLRGNRLARAGAAAFAAQAALLYGYYLWGGVKEVAAAALIATIAGLGFWVLESPRRWRTYGAPVLAAAALVGVLSAGGLIWLTPLAAALAVVLVRALGLVATALRLGISLAALAMLALPVAIAGALLPETSSPLSDSDARGNLLGPLDPVQIAGIWTNGDFRFHADAELVCSALIAIALVAAAGAIIALARAGELSVPVYALGTLAAAALLVAIGSPWVDGKALATASIVIPFAALLGAGLLWQATHRVEAGVVALAVIGGIAWSNALAYREVSLAPRAQLEELERIGDEFAGEGPTLVTEYSPYAARHFLREADPESISELRRRVVPRLDGTQVPKGRAADSDRIDPASLALYRTVVVRRSPAQSRLPAAYRPVFRGRYYEAWQRYPAPASPPRERIALGDRFDPLAVPGCARVRALADSPGGAGGLVAATRPPPLVVSLRDAAYPASWRVEGRPGEPSPSGPGTITSTVNLPRRAEYEIWLAGSVRPRVELRVDGDAVGAARGELNNLGGYVSLGRAELGPGSHEVAIEFAAPDLHPGSAGRAGPVGPLVFSSAGAADSELVTVNAAAAARRLCGRPWDWIEPIGGT